jgi:hypothetical protein
LNFIYLAETTVYRTKSSNETSAKGQSAFYRNVILPSKINKEKNKVRNKIHSILFSKILNRSFSFH